MFDLFYIRLVMAIILIFETALMHFDFRYHSREKKVFVKIEKGTGAL